MNTLGLSREAQARRRKYVQAGDASRLMAGEWKLTYRIKKGLEEDPELYDILPFFVQRNVTRQQMEMKRLMGLFTEPFNLAYCEQQTGRPIEYFSGNSLPRQTWIYLTERSAQDEELQVSETYPWMACNLDGMTTTAQGHRCPVDAKHVGRSDDPMILRYTAAGTHQATVMGCDWWALSVFVGNSKWEYIEQEVNPLYQAELIAATREFWGYVERDEEPEDRPPPGLPPKPQPKLRSIVVPTDNAEMLGVLIKQNNWLPGVLPEIKRFVETEPAAKVNGIARARIKADVPEDVGDLTYGLYHYKRTKAGSITMTMQKGTDDDA